MRRIHHFVLLDDPCLTCDQPVWAVRANDSTWEFLHPFPCPRLLVNLVTQNPLRLGTITALDYHGGED